MPSTTALIIVISIVYVAGFICTFLLIKSHRTKRDESLPDTDDIGVALFLGIFSWIAFVPLYIMHRSYVRFVKRYEKRIMQELKNRKQLN